MSAQTIVSTIGKILVMHSFLTDISTDPVRLRRSGPPVVRTHAPATRKTAEIGLGASPNSRGFVTLLSQYHASGGLARGDTLGRLLDDWKCGDYLSLARLIASGEIFSFRWRGECWIPMFQFELRDLSVKPGPRRVLAELMQVFDDWQLAVWFVRPNPWLQTKRPLDLLDSDLTGVLEVARADRFIVDG